MTLAARISALAGAIRDKLNTMTPRLLPAGGGAGQVLTKTTSADYAAAWAGLPAPKSATVTVPWPPRYEWEQAINDASLTGSEVIQTWLAPASSSDENEPEMLDLVALTAQASAGVVIFKLSFSELTSGPIRLHYKA
ncbi:hypothetical protein HOU03_gp126 [Caulobacter phage CcrSC]|uniref:Uncharacterized protein n=1 Tax=Caulobacter phage CcrSC TaxID=2283272 RepID=A0A385EFW9_9CAUD|nr:hypothetical protein HOU03_gp126 [Caulobacter phage CcrSC]AXQ69708.1 hypothetical protein CcrSC_gp126 [Caulobacter phage CcrSC]